MLFSAKDVRKCKIKARDGELGSVHDLFFDDRTWEVRYIVVDTGRWLPGRRVLIPREALGEPNWKVTELEVELTRDEIENAPGVETDPPLVHDVKRRYYDRYVWTSYPWGGFVGALTPDEPPRPAAPVAPPRAPKTHVRSAREITDYRIEANDGRIGRVEDFAFSDEDWKIRYLVIDTRRWLPGKKVVVPPEDVERMEWADQTVRVQRTKEGIKSAPRLAPVASASRSSGPRVMVVR